MKCPNCGKEVVIATDLCPWCGYEYNFDGAIPPKGEPEARDSEEYSRTYREEKRGARSYSGEEGDARDRWTQAGVYTAASGVSSSASRSKAARSERGMRWHNAVVSIILPLTGIYYIYRGVTNLGSGITSLSYVELMSALAPWLTWGVIAIALLCIAAGAAAFVARAWLSRFLRKGLTLYLAVIVVPPIASLVYSVCFAVYTDYYYLLVTLLLRMLIPFAYAIATGVYYGRRRDLFN